MASQIITEANALAKKRVILSTVIPSSLNRRKAKRADANGFAQ